MKLSNIKEEIKEIIEIKKNLEELKEIIKLEDIEIEKEIQAKLSDLSESIIKKKIKIFLSGKYDKGNVVLSVYAGAGGQDAQDWAVMLLRMYERYCSNQGFRTKILHQVFGDPGGPENRIGIKSGVLEIKGTFAYGFLKMESGVHRLVRVSPFSSQKLRHTSFALVEVLPELSQLERKDIKLNSDDLKIDTFCASGPGGQYVNKRKSAIRITHLPTGIIASCQSERLQGLNKEKAMKLLLIKLFHLKQKEKQKEMKTIKGKSVSAEWGNQIRSYVIYPYKMVKDLRTGYETSDVDAVLNGDLDKFIEAEIFKVA